MMYVTSAVVVATSITLSVAMTLTGTVTIQPTNDSVIKAVNYNGYGLLNRTGSADIDAINVARCMYYGMQTDINFSYTEDGFFTVITDYTAQDRIWLVGNLTECIKYVGDNIANLVVGTNDSILYDRPIATGSELAACENRNFFCGVVRYQRLPLHIQV